MSNQTTTKPRLRVEIEIVRDHNFYSYNRSENGKLIIYARPISPDQAAQIMAKFKGKVIARSGDLRFDDGPYQFSWTAEYWKR
jgi:hypothetical protein